MLRIGQKKHNVYTLEQYKTSLSSYNDKIWMRKVGAEEWDTHSFGHKNIRANSIAPGLIKTDFAKALWENPDILKTVLSSTPMQRIGVPDEIAGVADHVAVAGDQSHHPHHGDVRQ